MAVSSEFPGIAMNARTSRRTIRAEVNPLDKSTVISILPKYIYERKATIQPGIFEIQPGSFNNPAILVVGGSSWWRDIDEHQPLLEIPVSSIQVADSIVKDYCNGLLACNMTDSMPGLFYLPGTWDMVKVKTEQGAMLAGALNKQKKWFMELIKLADILWTRSNGNPLAISDDARLACKELNIQNKPWLGDMQAAELVRCVACGNLRNPAFPICAVCKAIADPELARKLGLTFAQ